MLYKCFVFAWWFDQFGICEYVTQQIQDSEPMSVQCCTSIINDGPTISLHWLSVLCLPHGAHCAAEVYNEAPRGLSVITSSDRITLLTTAPCLIVNHLTLGLLYITGPYHTSLYLTVLFYFIIVYRTWPYFAIPQCIIVPHRTSSCLSIPHHTSPYFSIASLFAVPQHISQYLCAS